MPRRYRRATESTISDSENDDDVRPLQQSRPRELPLGTAPQELSSSTQQREWISEEEWRINIQENPDVDRLRSPSVVSIFRVPNFLKDSKREAYVPKRVSLGPYHHRSAALTSMDNHKGRALRRMMTRYNINRNLPNVPNNMDFPSSAKDGVLELGDEIRNSYEEKIDCESDNLALMLSLDGCFILELLRTLGGDKFPVAEAKNYYEPVFDKNKIDFTGFDTLNDILMLENQIPLGVLLKLLELELDSVDQAKNKLFKVLVKYTRFKFYPFKYDMIRWSWPGDEQFNHLLGLLQRLIVYGTGPVDQIAPANKPVFGVKRIPRAVELNNVGINFEQCDGGIKNIKFSAATIFLPPLKVTDHTEVLFRNLVALEVCKASEINYVTCYLTLMDELINNEEDVAVLKRSGIVTNYLGNDIEVAELFNGLCKGVTMSRIDVFKQDKEQINDHYNSRLKVWLANLVKEHFSSPWRTLAVLGAIVGLLLTAVQTVFSIFSVYKP